MFLLISSKPYKSSWKMCFKTIQIICVLQHLDGFQNKINCKWHFFMISCWRTFSRRLCSFMQHKIYVNTAMNKRKNVERKRDDEKVNCTLHERWEIFSLLLHNVIISFVYLYIVVFDVNGKGAWKKKELKMKISTCSTN